MQRTENLLSDSGAWNEKIPGKGQKIRFYLENGHRIVTWKGLTDFQMYVIMIL